MSPTSNLSSTVSFGVSNCKFATIIWNVGAGPSLTMDWGANRRIFLRSASGIALDRDPVSMRPSMVSCPKSIGKYTIRFLYLSPRFVDKGIYAASPSLVTRTCKKADSTNRLVSDCSPFSIIGSSMSCSLVISELGCQNSMRALDTLLSGISGPSSSSVAR